MSMFRNAEEEQADFVYKYAYDWALHIKTHDAWEAERFASYCAKDALDGEFDIVFPSWWAAWELSR